MSKAPTGHSEVNIVLIDDFLIIGEALIYAAVGQNLELLVDRQLAPASTKRR